jgi:hypothetical protein
MATALLKQPPRRSHGLAKDEQCFLRRESLESPMSRMGSYSGFTAVQHGSAF